VERFQLSQCSALVKLLNASDPEVQGQLIQLAQARLQHLQRLQAPSYEVLCFMQEGFSTVEIALMLNITPRAVDKRKQQIYSVFGVQNERDATSIAVAGGLQRGCSALWLPHSQ